MDTNIVRDITDLYFNQVIGDYVTEVSANLALKASKEAGKRAGVLAGLSGGDPKVEAKARNKRAQAERLYTKQAKKRTVNITPIKEEELLDEAPILDAKKTEVKKRAKNIQSIRDKKSALAALQKHARLQKKGLADEIEVDGELVDEAKVDEKLPEYERATARDKRSGINLPGSGTRRVRRAEHEAKRGKPKRWWDDDGDGIGWEKGEVRKEAKEVKRWWDDDGDGKGYEEGEVSGKFKRKKKIKEGFSNWREDLIEVADKIKTNKSEEPKIVEKAVNNKIDINPKLKLNVGEAVEILGGTLIEMIEIDEVDFVVESVYDELLEEGYDEDDIEEALEYALTEATVTFGHDTDKPHQKKSGAGHLVKAVGRLARQKLASKVQGSKKAVAGAIASGARKVAKGALGVARKMEGGDKKPSTAHTAARKASTYRGAGAGQKEKVSSGSYTPPTKKKEEKPSDPWEGSASTPPKAKAKTKKAAPAAPKAKSPAAPKRKRKSKLDDLLASVRSEQVQIDEKTLSSSETREKERIVKSMKDKEADFEKRYPGRGKEVMYATATKMAKRMAEQAMETRPVVQSPQQTQQSSQDAKAKSAAQRAKVNAIQLKSKELATLKTTPAGTSVSSFG
jgi:hypothetical protein